MRKYKGIDMFKFIMALLVVVLHTHPLYGINDRLNFLTADVIARVAVPFFFAASGFLLEKKISSTVDIKEVIRRYIRKILGLYCIWTVVYLPAIIYDKILDTDDSLIRGILTTMRDFVFTGSYSHLWYLPSVAVGIVVVYTLRKYLGEEKTVVVLLILFIAGLLTQTYFGLLTYTVDSTSILWKMMRAVKKIMVTCRNGVFFGSIFIYMGTWVAKRDVALRMWKAFVGLAISMLLFYIEVSYLWTAGYVRETDMYVMLLPAVFFLLVISIQISVKGDTFSLRKMSMNIYFVHLYLKKIYIELIGAYTDNNVGLFLFTLIGALSIAYLMYRLSYLVERRET